MGLKQLETTKVTVGGNDFFIKPFSAFKAANLTGELVSVLSPLVSWLTQAVGGIDDIADMEAEEVGEQMMAGISGGVDINGDRLEALMRKLLLGGNIVVEREDDRGDITQELLNKDLADEMFCGNVQDMFVLCVHVIKCNYGGFFEKLSNLYGKEKEGEEEAKQRTIL